MADEHAEPPPIRRTPITPEPTSVGERTNAGSPGRPPNWTPSTEAPFALGRSDFTLPGTRTHQRHHANQLVLDTNRRRNVIVGLLVVIVVLVVAPVLALPLIRARVQSSAAYETLTRVAAAHNGVAAAEQQLAEHPPRLYTEHLGAGRTRYALAADHQCWFVIVGPGPASPPALGPASACEGPKTRLEAPKT